MSNQEHWEVIQHSWREIAVYSPTRQITMIDVEKSFDVNEDNEDACVEMALRQANLIAAAPELLEALEAIIERWDTPLWKDVPHTGNYINAARLVVAKAKGE